MTFQVSPSCALHPHAPTLTDYELHGLRAEISLADGHAYNDIRTHFSEAIDTLPLLWQRAAQSRIPDVEQLFRYQFGSLIRSPSLSRYRHFKICPTASNSIDLVAATLRGRNQTTYLVEPTFDNLALLLRRRGVQLSAIAEDALYGPDHDLTRQSLGRIPVGSALFLVNPNNPTGNEIDQALLSVICQHCADHRITLILDNCFRAFKRHHHDDYQLLIDSGCSFIAFEDTGKTWATQELKASLVCYSADLAAAFEEIYNEVYLCVSNFILVLMSELFERTQKIGLENSIIAIVETHRNWLRSVLRGSPLVVDHRSLHSRISVEWLSCADLNMTDRALTAALAERGLAILPGSPFYWAADPGGTNSRNVRVSLMKKQESFAAGLLILNEYLNSRR